MSLRAERDRFLAFAFAGAELLLEIDSKGLITFATGRCTLLSTKPLVGRPLADFLEGSESRRLRHILAPLNSAPRTGQFFIRTESGRLLAGGAAALPGTGERASVALNEVLPIAADINASRDSRTGLLDGRSFRTSAEDALRRARDANFDVTLTLLGIAGEADLLGKIEPHEAENYSSEIGALLSAHALGGLAGCLGEGKYGLLHKSEANMLPLEAQLASVAHEVAPNGPGISVSRETIPLDERVPSADFARAVIAAVKTFEYGADGPGSLAELRKQLESTVSSTLTQITHFREAIKKKRVSLVAQPIVPLAGGKNLHHEVLIRFRDGEATHKQVAFAEDTGLIQELDQAVVTAVSDFLDQETTPEDLTLAVNLSGRSLSTPHFADWLLKRLRTQPFRPAQLLFEITETSKIQDLSAVARVIERLRSIGHAVCIDDFGSGAACLHYLQSIDVDFVKIDGSYVQSLGSAKRGDAMLMAMLNLCRDLNVRVIAEMVEEKSQADWLNDMGVYAAQGWFFGKPVPLHALRRDPGRTNAAVA